MEVDVTIQTLQNFSWLSGFGFGSYEVTAEEKTRVSFLTTENGWFRIVDGEPIKGDYYYFNLAKGRINKNDLSRLWERNKSFADARAKLAERQHKGD